MNQQLAKIDDLLSSKNLPFCFYALPDRKEVQIIVHSNEEVSLTPDILEKNEPGFIFRPFDRTLPPKFIRASYAGDIEGFLWKKFQLLPDVERPSSRSLSDHDDWLKEDYLTQLRSIINELQGEPLDKVVFSRTMTQDTDLSPIQLYSQLLQTNAHAFRYLLHVGSGEYWLGASPEILLLKEGPQYHTVSLAGTVAAGLEEELFSEKNIHEQKVVSDYLVQKLKETKASNIQISAPQLSPASNVCHIKTKFSFALKEDSLGSIVQVAETLHPTPAVGGYPRELAEKVIKNREKTSRELYAGYLGVVHVLGDTALFVNIRCAQYLQGKVRLYVGGGIMPDSNPIEEWEETKVKAELIRGIL